MRCSPRSAGRSPSRSSSSSTRRCPCSGCSRAPSLEGRSDDTPEAIAKRLALYHELTEPVIEHYRNGGKVVGINADRSVDEVFLEVQAALERAGVA